MSQNSALQGTDLYIRTANNLSPLPDEDVKQTDGRDIIFVDPVGLIDRHNRLSAEATTNLLHDSLKALKRGGSVILFADIWTATQMFTILEDVGFKQLRYIQGLQPVIATDRSFHPQQNRMMIISAVKGGGSTFNGHYLNGEFHVGPNDEFIPCILKNLLEIHSNPGYVIANLAPGLGDAIRSLTLDLRQKPEHPKSGRKTDRTPG